MEQGSTSNPAGPDRSGLHLPPIEPHQRETLHHMGLQLVESTGFYMHRSPIEP
jgi:hypothetical protein